MSHLKLHDISQNLNLTSVWPGDTALKQEKLLDMNNGDHMTLSTIKSTTHLGSHADAPSHFIRNGKSIDEVDIENYVGIAQVIKLDIKNNIGILPKNLKTEIRAKRILLSTQTFNAREWNKDFSFLTLELIDFFEKKDVCLIGVDTPSIDPFLSKKFIAHKACYEKNISILEGLHLSDVKKGIYELIALPLKLPGFDASPVRAVLRKF